MIYSLIVWIEWEYDVEELSTAIAMLNYQRVYWGLQWDTVFLMLRCVIKLPWLSGEIRELNGGV